MQNLRDFFRHLAKPPEIKPKIRSIRMFFHQVKNARQRSATTSIQKSFRTFAVWIRHSKNKPVDESKPTTLKLMRHMLRKSKPPADKSFKSKNIFLYAFQR